MSLEEGKKHVQRPRGIHSSVRLAGRVGRQHAGR